MDEAMTMNALKSELLEAEHILNTVYSFERAEPNYIRCLEIIRGAPEMRHQVFKLLTSLFEANLISDEPLAFLMHVLRWSEVREWAEINIRMMSNPIATGRPLEKVIEAFDDDWENQEFYELFSKK
ncbi:MULTISPECIES: hypothetical protein [unclassified Duganella]|uniref:hypothetical protein n=1 Tax=unclassified Duganella TaxID=2636909 RepID=UPI0006F72372|nr:MULTISPECIES: hypothetical protein [unclassified Duganella]KQV51515.1 hypothetical protein ASD07_29565 [Duganella sp. Root336D2]KRB87661.1 hypothetical protein ASE26_29400 [Duganella sp. Root198D2]